MSTKADDIHDTCVLTLNLVGFHAYLKPEFVTSQTSVTIRQGVAIQAARSILNARSMLAQADTNDGQFQFKLALNNPADISNVTR